MDIYNKFNVSFALLVLPSLIAINQHVNKLELELSSVSVLELSVQNITSG